MAQPTPLDFMDEIDAALDLRNVFIVVNYTKDRTKNAQLVIISLRYTDTPPCFSCWNLSPADRKDVFELSH